MNICVVTDRTLRPDLSLDGLIGQAAASGADLIQLREKDLGDAELLRGAQLAVARGAAQRPVVPVLVNGRPDVALAAGAAGVHLPADGLGVADVAARWRGRLRIGVSAHSVAEAIAACNEGADYVMLGPVFETPSKRAYGAPLGVAVLREACRQVSIPVWAIGGINVATAPALRGVPVAGVAVIAAVMGARDMARAVSDLRQALGSGADATRRGAALGVEEVCR